MARAPGLAPRPSVGRRRDRFASSRATAFDLDLVVLPTSDGHRWDGMLYRPRHGDPGRHRLAVLVVHGSLGNYLTGIPRRLSFALARAGFPVLAINTRMANYGLVFGEGLLHRTPLDLDAGIDLLRRLGYDRIVLCGYSMGATMVTNYQATRELPDVAGVLTVAHPCSLPDSLRRRWERFGASPGYDEVEERARSALAPHFDAPDNDRIFVVQRGAGPSERPEHAEVWSYRTWWFSRGPEASHAISALGVQQLSVPLAIIQAGDDQLVGPDDGPELARLARGARCPSARLAVIAGASHAFDGHSNELTGLCEAWLSGLSESTWTDRDKDGGAPRRS